MSPSVFKNANNTVFKNAFYQYSASCLFPLTDMQTPPLKSVPSQKVIMNGAECSEWNEKNN